MTMMEATPFSADLYIITNLIDQSDPPKKYTGWLIAIRRKILFSIKETNRESVNAEVAF